MELANPEDRGFNGDRLRRIDRFLEESYLNTGRLKTMQLLVLRDGQPVHYYQGGTLRDDGTPMRGKGKQFVPHGAKVMMAFPGGAGYGPATERPKDLVKRDLLRGYISAEVAAADYGLSAEDIREVQEAIRKGTEAAKKNVVQVAVTDGTIPHEIVGRFGAAKILFKPASPGTGVIASGGTRIVLELAGVHDILTKSLGSNNVQNSIKATIVALSQLRSAEMVARERGVPADTLRAWG